MSNKAKVMKIIKQRPMMWLWKYPATLEMYLNVQCTLLCDRLMHVSQTVKSEWNSFVLYMEFKFYELFLHKLYISYSVCVMKNYRVQL